VSGDPADALSVVFRSRLTGFADLDSAAPTVFVSSAKATKLRRPAGAYSIRLTLAIRDNEAENTVSYVVTADGGPALGLAEKKGSTAPGSVTTTLRVRPGADVRMIVLRIKAEDPVGNTRWSTRRLKLPR